MSDSLKVKMFVDWDVKSLETSLALFSMKNPNAKIENSSHQVSHFESGVYGPERTEKHWYTIWYREN